MAPAKSPRVKRSKDEIAKKTLLREKSIMVAETICRQGVSIRNACARLNANRTTLSRRMNGGKSHRQASQESQYLTPEEENAISENIRSAFPGTCPTLGRNALRKIGQSIIDNEFRKNNLIDHKHISESWENRLRQREPALNKYKRNKKIYTSLNVPVFEREFNNLQIILESYNISLDNLFSFGEMSLYSLNSAAKREVDTIGIDASYREGFLDVFYDSEKTNMVPAPTVYANCFEACSATGVSLPSYVTFYNNDEKIEVSFEGAVHISSTDLDTHNDEAFLAWLQFFHNLTKRNDGNSYRAIYFGAHYFNLSMQVLQFVIDHHILFFVSPPERPHIQPVYNILEMMKENVLNKHPSISKNEILASLQLAKSSISKKRVLKSWEDSGLLNISSHGYIQRVLSQTVSASAYRRDYAKKFRYSYGRKTFNGAGICKICHPCTMEFKNLKVEHENSEDSYMAIEKQARVKCLEILSNKAQEHFFSGLKCDLDSIDVAHQCQVELRDYTKSFGLSLDKSAQLLFACTSFIINEWNKRNERPNKSFDLGSNDLMLVSLQDIDGPLSPESVDLMDGSYDKPEVSLTESQFFSFDSSPCSMTSIPSSQEYNPDEYSDVPYDFGDQFINLGEGS